MLHRSRQTYLPMRRQHHSRQDHSSSRFKPFLLVGAISASLLMMTANPLQAAETSATTPIWELAPTGATPPVPQTSSTATPAAAKIGDLFKDVRQYFGIRYRFGGTTPAGFDCSGFVRFMFGKIFNMQLPRSSGEMAAIGRKVDRSDLRPGDLVLFRNARNRISHVGIFVGNGVFVHSSTSKGITKDRLSENYYERRFATGIRILDLPEHLLQQDFEKLLRESADNDGAS